MDYKEILEQQAQILVNWNNEHKEEPEQVRENIRVIIQTYDFLGLCRPDNTESE